jgi:hypothetical protein
MTEEIRNQKSVNAGGRILSSRVALWLSRESLRAVEFNSRVEFGYSATEEYDV